MKYSREAYCLSYGLKLLKENIPDKDEAHSLKVALIQKTMDTYKSDEERFQLLKNFLEKHDDPSCKDFIYCHDEMFFSNLEELFAAFVEAPLGYKNLLRTSIRSRVALKNEFLLLSECLYSQTIYGSMDEELAAFCLTSYEPLDWDFLGKAHDSSSRKIKALLSDYIHTTGIDMDDPTEEPPNESYDNEEDDEEKGSSKDIYGPYLKKYEQYLKDSEDENNF